MSFFRKQGELYYTIGIKGDSERIFPYLLTCHNRHFVVTPREEHFRGQSEKEGIVAYALVWLWRAFQEKNDIAPDTESDTGQFAHASILDTVRNFLNIFWTK